MKNTNVYHLKFSVNEAISQVSELNHSFSRGTLRVGYCGDNCNRTPISKEAFEKAVPSMFNCPIVANYDIEADEINGHDMAYVENGDESRLVNLTEPVGVVPESATWRWETLEDNGVVHDYFCIDGVILWKRQPCYSKIVSNGITAQSMEIKVNKGEMISGELNVDEFEYEAFCLLERDEPCFEQAALQVFAKDGFKEQMREMMQEYANTLSADKGEGGNMETETTNYENVEPTVEPVEVVENQEQERFSLTAKEIEAQLASALSNILGEDFYHYFIEDWTDTEVYVSESNTGKVTGYNYIIDGNAVIVDAESGKPKRREYVDVESDEASRSQVGQLIDALVTQANDNLKTEYDEKVSGLNETISNLESQVEELVAFKNERLAAERTQQENEIFEKFDGALKGVEAYQSLKDNAAKYSIEELETRCYALFGRNKFSLNKEQKPTHRVPLSHDGLDEDADSYGGLLRGKTRRV